MTDHISTKKETFLYCACIIQPCFASWIINWLMIYLPWPFPVTFPTIFTQIWSRFSPTYLIRSRKIFSLKAVSWRSLLGLLRRNLVVDASPEGSFKATLQKVWSRIFTIGFLIEWSLPTGLSFNLLYHVENLLKEAPFFKKTIYTLIFA